MDGGDSDVEMFGSPVLPSIKNENEVEIDENDCFRIVVVDEAELDENVDRDPMNLLKLLDRRESSDNEKHIESTSHDNNKVSKDNENSDEKLNNDYCNDDDSSYKASIDEGSSDRESESEDTVFAAHINNKVHAGKVDAKQKEIAAEKLSKHITKLAESTPWVCKDQDNPDRIFCLYCAVSLTNKSFSSAKHGETQLHQERAAEYLSFMENAGEDVICLKTNKDYDGDIKKVRISLEEKLSDYVWNLWSKTHNWIVRTKTTGYTGYCKYCSIDINVSTLRLRKTHEESIRHNEGKKKYPQRRKTVTDVLNVDSEYSDEISNRANDRDKSMQMSLSSNVKDIVDPTENEYFEKSKSSADLCRCKLCEITMFKSSFARHSSSNLHKQNLAVLDNPVVPDRIEKPDWTTVQTLHPWLIEDPDNAMEAFCKYCKKRIIHGTSAAKRLIHEHSAPHKMAVQKSASAEDEKSKPNEDEIEKESVEESSENSPGSLKEDDDENDNEDLDNETDHDQLENELENSETETETETETESNKLLKNQPGVIPQCIKSYQRDGKYVFCRYCKIVLQNLKKTIKMHCKTQRHTNCEKLFLKRSNAVKRAKAKMKTAEPIAKVPAAAVMCPEYPWLVKFKNKADVVFCKYCRVRFSARANRIAHQNTHRHVEAAKKFEEKFTEKQVLEKPSSPIVPPLKITISRTLFSSKNALKKKVPQHQLKAMFDWLQFKKGMQLNYGYCTVCEKPVFIPSIKYGNKHKRTGFHLRAQNKIKRQNEAQTLKRHKTDSDHNQDKNKNDDSRPNVSEEPPPKRFKANSLQTAIQTAKRLTSIHLEMLTFMRNNGSRDPKPTTRICTSDNQNTKEVSTIADLNAKLSPIVFAGTQANNRDPFDLFFNGISASTKVLPPDLASEAKLKVTQVLFELETRAQQRQEQQQKQKNSSDQTTVSPNGSTNALRTSDIPSTDSIIIDSPTNQIERECVRVEPNSNQQPKQLAQQQTPQKFGQGSFTETITTTPISTSSPKTFYAQTSAQNSVNGQHLQVTTLTPQHQMSCNNAQVKNGSVAKIITPSNLSPLQANTIVHAQCKVLPRPQQEQVAQQNIPIPITQRDGLERHRIVTNQLNNLVSNVNQRINVTNSIVPVNLLATDSHSNSNSTRTNNRAPQLRTVPLSSLTKAKYQNIPNNDPTFHPIQLNPSTQSNNFQRR